VIFNRMYLGYEYYVTTIIYKMKNENELKTNTIVGKSRNELDKVVPVPVKAVMTLLSLPRLLSNGFMIVVGLLCFYFAISQRNYVLFLLGSMAFFYPLSIEGKRLF